MVRAASVSTGRNAQPAHAAHSCATHGRERRRSPHGADILGHADISTTAGVIRTWRWIAEECVPEASSQGESKEARSAGRGRLSRAGLALAAERRMPSGQPAGRRCYLASDMKPPTSTKPSPVPALRQRNASIHTIKAYSGDLDEFAAYARREAGTDRSRHHSRLRPDFTKRVEQDRWRARWRRCVALSLAGAEGAVPRIRPPWSRLKLATKLPRSNHRNGVLDGKCRRSPPFPSATHDARVALWLRHPQLELIGINLGYSVE